MAFRVLYDANAIFGTMQRSILVRAGIRQARFNLRVLATEEILDEMVRAVGARYPDIQPERRTSLKTAIMRAIPDCLVTGYDHALEASRIGDPGDRHVVAAAIHANAQLIVTQDNDFTQAALAPHGLAAQSPDDFLADLFDLDQATARELVCDEASARHIAPDTLVDLLEERGLIRFARHLRG